MDTVIVTSNGLMDQEWFGYTWHQVYEANKGSDLLLKIQLRGDNWTLVAEEIIGNCQKELNINDFYKAQIKIHGRISKTTKEISKDKTNTTGQSGLFD